MLDYRVTGAKDAEMSDHSTAEGQPDGGPARLPAVRVGDAERNSAAEALGEHFAAGRLDTAELDERLKLAYAARTYADLEPLFTDLPAPRPFAPRPPAPPVSAASRSSRAAGRPGDWRQPGWRRPPPVSLIPLLIVFAIVFTALVHFPPFFLFFALWMWPRWGRRAWR
jgi:Domain of unknown function (DUF1707)